MIVSWDDYIFHIIPNIWKIIQMFQTTNQCSIDQLANQNIDRLADEICQIYARQWAQKNVMFQHVSSPRRSLCSDHPGSSLNVVETCWNKECGILNHRHSGGDLFTIFEAVARAVKCSRGAGGLLKVRGKPSLLWEDPTSRFHNLLEYLQIVNPIYRAPGAPVKEW